MKVERVKLIERLAEAEVKILMRLTNGERVLTDLSELRIGYGTIYRALGNLKEMGLIKERAQGVKRLLSLTEKGEHVAKVLKELDEFLSK
ncbi:MAG: helix-turn-helix domain-containing protein [Candidatus Methanomethylicaceae archaeon]